MILLLMLTLVAGQLLRIQYLDRDRLVSAGQSQRDASRPLPAARGVILDRHGVELAVSVDTPTIVADPSKVTDPEGYAELLGPLLGVEAATLVPRLSAPESGDKRFAYLARQVDPHVADGVAELGLVGVASYPEPTRHFPGGRELAGAIVGSVDVDHVGISGLEAQWETVLEGESGIVEFERANDGSTIPTGEVRVHPATRGDDLVLTLDQDLQWLTVQELTHTVETMNAASAMAVVLHSKSGDVLAMASVERNDEDGTVAPTSHNASMTDVFEPGSISKVFTVAAAMEEGTVSPGTTFLVEPSIDVYDATITDEFREEPTVLTVDEIVRESSNVGTVKIADTLDRSIFASYLSGFGFGSATGPGGEPQFPFEADGILPDPSHWSGTSQATISYGQGISVTAVQMAAAYNALANGGTYIEPRLVSATIDSSGTEVPTPAAGRRRVVSRSTSDGMREILEGNVHDGTAQRAAVPNYCVAGKTGTARKPDPGNGGYLEGTWMSTFAGFAPAEDPELTIVVVVDDPKPDYYGGLVAAPLFSTIAESGLRRLQVAPSTGVREERLDASC